MTLGRKNMTKQFFLRLKYYGWRYLTASFLNWRFPFLRYSGDKWFTNASWYYQIPDGWRKAFGYRLCWELDRELRKWNYVHEYKIIDIKEKWGYLDWSDYGYPIGSKIFDIITKYSTLSETTCKTCGRKAKYISGGWISPYCKKHIGDRTIDAIIDRHRHITNFNKQLKNTEEIKANEYKYF